METPTLATTSSYNARIGSKLKASPKQHLPLLKTTNNNMCKHANENMLYDVVNITVTTIVITIIRHNCKHRRFVTTGNTTQKRRNKNKIIIRIIKTQNLQWLHWKWHNSHGKATVWRQRCFSVIIKRHFVVIAATISADNANLRALQTLRQRCQHY